MNTKELIKSHIENQGLGTVDKDYFAKKFETSESNVRKALAELMVEGKMIYYPVRTVAGLYHRYIGTRSDVHHIESEFKLLSQSMATTYFKRLQVYKKLLKAHAKELQFPMLLEKVEQLEIIFGEISEMKGKE